MLYTIIGEYSKRSKATYSKIDTQSKIIIRCLLTFDCVEGIFLNVVLQPQNPSINSFVDAGLRSLITAQESSKHGLSASLLFGLFTKKRAKGRRGTAASRFEKNKFPHFLRNMSSQRSLI